MKIRLKGNSIRFRLNRPDITQLGQLGYIEESTAFTADTLSYAIVITEDGQLTSEFKRNKILLRLPKHMINELISTDTVGFSDQSGPVNLLIEKDFTCLDNTDEDQSDNYPNPLLAGS